MSTPSRTRLQVGFIILKESRRERQEETIETGQEECSTVGAARMNENGHLVVDECYDPSGEQNTTGLFEQ